MSDQYLGEIRTFGFNFAPVGWALCNGQLLAISQNAALFSLIGTYFGGNGTSNFALPNLQGNAPMQWGNGTGLSNYVLGQPAGTTTVTITVPQMPNHSHAIQVGEAGTPTNIPSPTTWLGEASPAKFYLPAADGPPNVPLSQNAIGTAGGSQPHNNTQPYLTINFCIALTGAFPPRG
jgi:microcystin-dependent protein